MESVSDTERAKRTKAAKKVKDAKANFDKSFFNDLAARIQAENPELTDKETAKKAKKQYDVIMKKREEDTEYIREAARKAAVKSAKAVGRAAVKGAKAIKKAVGQKDYTGNL